MSFLSSSSSPHGLDEKYIILLLLHPDTEEEEEDMKPIQNELHLQKELFMLSRIDSDIDKKYFQFEAHKDGPYSKKLHSMIRELQQPPYYYFLHVDDSGKIYITEKGKESFENLCNYLDLPKNEKFVMLQNACRLIRKIYDNLKDDELVFLMSQSYPEYFESHKKHKNILKKSRQIIEQLKEKGQITDEKYQELLKRYAYRK